MTPWKHALSSASKFGGDATDYIALHNWFDETKGFTGDWTHRALRHHAAGIEEAIRKFGHVIHATDDVRVATKLVAEQHVVEDCGFIPTVADWLKPLAQHPESWMLKVGPKATLATKLEIDPTK
jgi:hypothetical protein